MPLYVEWSYVACPPSSSRHAPPRPSTYLVSHPSPGLTHAARSSSSCSACRWLRARVFVDLSVGLCVEISLEMVDMTGDSRCSSWGELPCSRVRSLRPPPVALRTRGSSQVMAVCCRVLDQRRWDWFVHCVILRGLAIGVAITPFVRNRKSSILDVANPPRLRG